MLFGMSHNARRQPLSSRIVLPYNERDMSTVRDTPGTQNVLIIAFHFPPQRGSSGLLRTLKFCRYLPEFGSSGPPRIPRSSLGCQEASGLSRPLRWLDGSAGPLGELADRGDTSRAQTNSKEAYRRHLLYLSNRLCLAPGLCAPSFVWEALGGGSA